MKNSGSLGAIIAVAMLGILVIMVGSIKRKPMIVETTATANQVERSTEFGLPETAAFNDLSDTAYAPEITTMIVDGDRLIIGTEDGLYLMPVNYGKMIPPEVISPEKREIGAKLQCLNVILPLGNDRYAGGKGLFKLDSDYSIDMAEYYSGESINAVMEYSDGLLVGTDKGLWFHCTDPIDENGCVDAFIKPGVIVTALASDRNGLWVGTYGDGLFYYDGRNWQERYLRRDTFALAFVNALEYTYPYLWVGTDQGIFRYNGGKWSQIFVQDSSEIYFVNTVTTTPAATYIGTENGLLRFAGDSLRTVDTFAGMAVAKLCANKKDVIVATRTNGIYNYNRKEEIVSPDQLTTFNVSKGCIGSVGQATPDNKTKEVLAGTEEYSK